MNRLARTLLAAVLATACMLAQPATGRADLAVTVNTSALPAGYTYALDFQFGLGGPNTSNSATVYGLSGGTLDPTSIMATGPVTGDNLASVQGVTLSGTTMSPFSEFTQNFSPGTALTFDVAMSNNAQALGGMDGFTFGLLYYDTTAGTFLPVSTSSVNTYGAALLEVYTNPNGPVTYITSYSTDPRFVVPEPSVSVIGVPEPGAVSQLLIGLPVLLLLGWRLR